MTSTPRTSVLLVGDPHYGALAALRALSAAGYLPWLAVSEPGIYAHRSRAKTGTVLVPDPSFDSEGFVRELAASAARLSVAAVLPSAEHHLLALADREADFAGIALGTPSHEIVERATDKELLLKLAATAGLQTPPTQKIVHSNGETVDRFGFPAVVKPLRSRVTNPDGTLSHHSAHYILDEQGGEVLKYLPGKQSLLQPYIPGQLISISGVSWKGELICAVHQAAVRIWPVTVGGSSYAETISPNAELEQCTGRLLQAIGWSGLFQAQFIRTPESETYLLDLNPRVYGSLALAVAAGLNLPAIWTDLLLGRRPVVGGYRVGVRYRHEEHDVRALAHMLVKGEYQRALRGFVPHRGTTHAIFSLRDPMPLLVTAAKLVRKVGLAPKGKTRT